MSIARYFGPDASYDAVKSFFGKEISKAANQLKTANPDHQGSRRGIPTRCSAGPSRRPQHLYFDDEDISVLTQREIEAVEARFGQSMRAPAKRPRVIKASPRPSTEPETIHANPVADLGRTIPAPPTKAEIYRAPTPADLTRDHSRTTKQTQSYPTVPENRAPSRKRPFSEIADSIESQEPVRTRPNTPPQSQSFGYVTNLGQFRCALCMSQLPTKEDLDRHERISKEHLRNLKTEPKLSKAREKLAQVTAVPAVGQHHDTPAPIQPLRINDLREPAHLMSSKKTPQQEDPASQYQYGTPSDTIEVGGRAFSSVPYQPSTLDTTPASQLDLGNANFNKGKGRAASLASPVPPPQAHPIHPIKPRAPSVSVPVPDTRPTTARTEIGTLDTPQTVKSFFTAPQQQQPHVSDAAEKKVGNGPAFSSNELADVMRATEIMRQLLACVQTEAKAVHASQSEGTSFDSGVQMRSKVDVPVGPDGELGRGSDSAAASETVHASSSSETSHDQQGRVPHAISAPGIDVYTGMRRESN